MESSAHNRPSTSERSRRGHDPIRIAHENLAISGPVAQEEGILARSYERFLGLPVAVVLAMMWVAGVALLGSCALTLYLLGSSLLHILN
jgi:hypothetical protein